MEARSVWCWTLGMAIGLLPITLAAQAADSGGAAWDVTVPRGETRVIEFETDEGTWMSVDAAPDGGWLVFDLLGHVYRVPAGGGAAESLTQGSGIAINVHPRVSPDGRTIAFVSDRGGQNNLWLMDADGSNPRAVFTDPGVRVAQPAWTPDGEYILVQRSGTGPGAGSGIWMYHREGGQGVELVSAADQPSAAWPAPSRDGRWVYFQVTTQSPSSSGQRDALGGGTQVRRLDLRTGAVTAVTMGEEHQQVRASSGGAAAPEVSPDGRWLAFVRRIPDGTVSWKGHRFGPRSALFLRDLQTGEERLLLDPVEIDLTEGGGGMRPFPGYSWSADGRTIVIAQGGGLHRLDVASGRLANVPFEATVRREISEQAYTAERIGDGAFDVRFLRWQTASPDGRRLAFQALNRVWVVDLPDGTPRRLTTATDGAGEYAPAWSPDGRTLAYTTFEPGVGGHVWTAPVQGGAPTRLTTEPAEYVHPAWRPDGGELVVARGSGATLRERGMVWSTHFDVVRVPAGGGAAVAVARVAAPAGFAGVMAGIRTQIVRPSWGPEGRIFFPRAVAEEGGRTELVSVRPDGSDERVHLTFPYADEVVPSPDGRWAAFQESDDVFLVPLPFPGAAGEPVRVERKRGTLPVRQLSTEGGLFPRWRDAGTVEFGSGTRYFAHDVARERTDTVAIALRSERGRARGDVALVGGRILTLDDRRVIERGAVVVRDGRIACVGDCDTAGVDEVVDVTGKTLVPGFVDVHSHNFREHRGLVPFRNYENAIFLAYGVTSVMDPSMWAQNIFPAAELVEAGLQVGPRVFTTGDPLYAGDGSRQHELASREDADDAIAKLQDWGAVSLKQYRQPRREQRQWVTDVARERGMLVTSENGDLPYVLGMVMDGHTGFEHPLSYVPLYRDVTTFLGRAGIYYSPTFAVGGPGPWNEEFFLAESEVWRDAKQRRFLPWRQLIAHTRRRLLRPDSDYSYPLIAQGLADVIAAGGYGAIGAHAQQNGIASHWEIWMAASALGAMGALEVASLHGARFIGRAEDLGSIEEGKLADLLVLNANPLDDIRATADLRYVMKDGRLYDADTLDEVWPERRPFGEHYWVNEDVLRAGDVPLDWRERR